MAFPSTVKVDGVDIVLAADWNDQQDEILSMESLSQKTTVVYEDFMIVALPTGEFEFAAVSGAPSPTIDTANHEIDITSGTTAGGTGNYKTLLRARLDTVTSIEVECTMISSAQASDVGTNMGITFGNSGANGCFFFPSSGSDVTALTRSGGDTTTVFAQDITSVATYNVLATSAAVSFKVDGVEKANHTTDITVVELLNGLMAVRTGDTTDRTGNYDYFYMKVIS